MSIQSEITRIAGAKSNIADAIEAKGVTVPSSTKIDGYAPLIAQIPTGNVVITETPDPAGGTVLEVTGGIDLSNDTVAADKLLYGYTAHDSTARLSPVRSQVDQRQRRQRRLRRILQFQ